MKDIAPSAGGPAVEMGDQTARRRSMRAGPDAGGTGAAPPRVIMVAARTGGLGKTVLAHAFYAALRRREIVPQVYAIDSTDESPVSKLGGWLSGVVELRTGADLERVAMRGDRAPSHLDSLADVLMSSAAVIDVGPNVIHTIVAWGQLTAIGSVVDRQGIALVVPVRDSEIAVTDAVAVVESARAAQAEGGIPFSNIVIAINTVEDGEDVLAHSSRGRLEKLDVRLMTIPREPNMLRILELKQKEFLWAYGLHGRNDFDKIKAELGSDVLEVPFTAIRYLNAFRGWLDAIDAEAARVGLVAGDVTKRG